LRQSVPVEGSSVGNPCRSRKNTAAATLAQRE
jgi:hypothetical protein